MNHPTVSIICAIDDEQAIGRENRLPWHIPSDLKRFKAITAGHPVIMGRKTFESIGRPLPKRLNIIITRDQQYTAEGCTVVHSLDEALEKAADRDSQEVFVIGGAEIFRQAVDYADKLYLTLVAGTHQGDTFFPDYSAFSRELFRESHEENGYSFTFVDLVRP